MNQELTPAVGVFQWELAKHQPQEGSHPQPQTDSNLPQYSEHYAEGSRENTATLQAPVYNYNGMSQGFPLHGGTCGAMEKKSK